MRINHNITALNTYLQLANNNDALAKTTEKLSSGLRINRAGDDAAGLAISEKMRGQIRGLDQASRNAQDGISLIQTAEGGLNETHSILQRMRELATQSASDTNTPADRQTIQKETDQLALEITRIANTTEFNSQNLLNGGVKATGGIAADTFQIGANAGQNLSLEINAMDAKSLGISGDTTTASVAAGAVNIAGVTLGANTGAGVVPGAAVVVSASTTAVSTAWTTAALGITGTTIASTAQSSQYNDYKIITTKTGGAGTDVTAAIDTNAKTITINYDSAVTTANSTAAKLNAAFASAGIGLTATTDATAVAGQTGAAATTAGLASNEVKVTLTNGGTVESTIISNTATSASFVDPTKYNGVTLNFTAAPTNATAGTINVAKSLSTAASFTNGVKTASAVAAAGIDVSSSGTAASNAITTIDKAIQSVSAERAKLGAVQNRMEHTINNLNTSSENLTSAESRIRDVDMAKTMMEQTKNNILAQAAQAMLAQANQQPQGVLQLLR